MSTHESEQIVEMASIGYISDLEAQLLTKAIQDAAFRERLISDPKAVLSEQGLNIPDDVQITVLQETSNQFYLVLPALEIAAESNEGAELSDEELETVAGSGTSADSRICAWTGCALGQSGVLRRMAVLQPLVRFSK